MVQNMVRIVTTNLETN